MRDDEQKLTDRNIYIALAVATVLLYGSSLRWDFVFDDLIIIRDNPNMRSLGAIVRFFQGGAWANSPMSMAHYNHDYYRPLHMTLLGLVAWASGVKAAAFHLVNLIMQGINAVLVYRVIKRLTGDERLLYPFMGALLFAVHPIHVEPVNWICGGTDLLLAMFILSSFLAYLRFGDNDDERWFAASLALFACALLTKEVAVIFPLVVCAYDVVVGRRARFGRWGAYAVAAGGYLLMRSAIIGSGNLDRMHLSGQGVARFLDFVGEYVKLTFWPWPLSLHQGPQQFGIGAGLFALVVAAFVLPFAIKDRRRIFCLLWFVVFLAPPLALAFTTPTPRSYLFADRYLYLPSIGVCALFSLALPSFKANRGVVALGAGILFVVLGTVTVIAGRSWKDEANLFTPLIRQHPDVWANYKSVGECYELQGKQPQALAVYSDALTHITNPKERTEIYTNMGRAYGMSGQIPNAVQSFNAALVLDPENIAALIGLGSSSPDYESASRYYTRALEIDRNNYFACSNLVRLNESFGYREKAAAYRTMCNEMRSKAYVPFSGSR